MLVVIQALGLVAGYPCRTISPQNPKQKSFKDRSSSTGCGYHSTMKYIERSPELVFALLENVQAMFFNWKQFGDECPMQIQTETMRKLGFQPAFSVCVNSSDYGLAQSRSRAWVLYIRGTHMKCLVGIYHCFFGVQRHSSASFRFCLALRVFQDSAQVFFVWRMFDGHLKIQCREAWPQRILERQAGPMSGSEWSQESQEGQGRWREVEGCLQKFL